MDFSSVISSEISKKRKSLSSRKSKRSKNRDESDNKQLENDIQIDKTAEIREHKDSFTNNDKELLNSITDAQLNEKLAEFDKLTQEENLTKLEKIKKLQFLVKQRAKNEKYKTIIEKEAEFSKDPAKKTIDLNYITEIDTYRDKLYVILRVCIKDMIRNWEDSINYSEYQTAVQKKLLHETKRDIVKLLYKLRSHKLNDDMLTSLTTIVFYLQSHDFRRANESYMKLSIGNVAWPIGVQNVGIHARSASSKIAGATKAANIMVDDKTRRWITAIKRIITATERIHKNS
ncbi:U5 small nuclear ribonucleo protein particle protein [Scheffersomyces stipitis CBS 6054]|uniref:Pre-mRNA-splicing factor 18 n=1 Tax=Scheffersomyces stipitis (strain ATCC 58785 / CBS 6054 / NBRC 10063 / NRRL Y-11545) TaxID=322104 RepID=A3LMZ1_PICST|nr:U5 small nuclear ribonucleo protein particle protein [Scheffersomyces stipitis CBS 6054]ABN64769.2 U5 small nuclear ribonucleo protein particle protein [Scheffersomyces stipitis CBS 6054]